MATPFTELIIVGWSPATDADVEPAERRKIMAKFRGVVQSDKSEATRLSHRLLTVQAQSWNGKVVTQIFEKDVGPDERVIWTTVSLHPHNGVGTKKVLYEGPVNPESN